MNSIIRNRNRIKNKIKEANSLMTENKIDEALKIYRDLREENPYEDLTYFIANCFYKHGDWQESLKEYEILLAIDKKNEIYSLGKYLCCVELQEYEKAITELERFSMQNSIKLYKDTIEELFDDMKKGNATVYQERVINLALLHGLKIPDELFD